MNRALPSWAIDLIRDGVPRKDLAAKSGDKALWSALYRLALSAHQRGWDAMELEAAVFDSASTLGFQLRTKDGTRPRSDKQIRSLLKKTWDRAVTWLSEQNAPTTRRSLAEDITRRAADARVIAGNPDAPLLDGDRAVLTFAADEMTRRHMTKVALPWRAISAATGLKQRTVQKSLARLVDANVLVKLAAGTVAVKSEVTGQLVPGRAAIYGVLPRPGHPYLCPENGAYGTSLGPPSDKASRDPLKSGSVMGPPDAAPVTFTVTAEQAALLRRLAAEAGITVDAHTEEKP